MTQKNVTMETLSSLMDFDGVIQVHEDGTITFDNSDILEPTLTMEVDTDGQSIHADDQDLIDQAKSYGWNLLTGFSGQDNYRGPVMHASEFIGGRLAQTILETPGYYVSLAVECEGPENDENENENPLEPAGWAVAYREV